MLSDTYLENNLKKINDALTDIIGQQKLQGFREENDPLDIYLGTIWDNLIKIDLKEKTKHPLIRLLERDQEERNKEKRKIIETFSVRVTNFLKVKEANTLCRMEAALNDLEYLSLDDGVSVEEVPEVEIFPNSTIEAKFLHSALKISNAVVKVRAIFSNVQGQDSGKATGTGFFLNQDTILTAAHVVNYTGQYASTVYIRQDNDSGANSLKEECELYACCTELDLAVLRLPSKLPIDLPETSSTVPQVGARVYIISHPGGGLQKFAFQNNEVIDITGTKIHYTTTTDKGSSGAPVFNDQGVIVGVHLAGKEKIHNIGISWQEVDRFIKDIKKYLVAPQLPVSHEVQLGKGNNNPHSNIEHNGASELTSLNDYQQEMDKARWKVRDTNVANRILNLLVDLRLKAKDHDKRRWIWELIQNAKDVATSKGLNLSITYSREIDKGVLQFQHNGRFFTIYEIAFLIEQVSSKDQGHSDEKGARTTGKFGSGFLTTHLLSEKVWVSGVVKEKALPAKPFKLPLDRSGKSCKEIIESIEESTRILNELLCKPDFIKFTEGDEFTSFVYYIDSKSGVETADAGISDLITSLPITLSFNSAIKSLQLVHEKKSYRVIEARRKEEGPDIKVECIEINDGVESKYVYVGLAKRNDCTIGFELEYLHNKVVFKKLPKNSPRLYCDFPLVGTEDLGFPVVINSSKFNPVETRNGVFLTNVERVQNKENKAIMYDALELYFTVVDYAARNEWGNLAFLASLPAPANFDWLTNKWYNNSILHPAHKKILKTPLVKTHSQGYLPIEQGHQTISFPYHKDKEMIEKIWDLCSQTKAWVLPDKTEAVEWVRQEYCKNYRLTLPTICEFIEQKRNIQNLAKSLGLNTELTIVWLDEFFSLVIEDDDTYTLIKKGSRKIIPNQDCDFCSNEFLLRDENVEEFLKEAMKLLGKNWYSELLHWDLKRCEHFLSLSLNQVKLISEINSSISEGENENIDSACNVISSGFSNDPDFPIEREQIFQFLSKCFPEDKLERRKINKWAPNIWFEVDSVQIERVLKKVHFCKNLLKLESTLQFSGKAECIEWLKNLIEFIVLNEWGDLLDNESTAILPSQTGEFKTKEELFKDSGDIPPVLIDICKDLGHDFRQQLLHQSVCIDFPASRVIDKTMVASRITQEVSPRLSEIPRGEHTKKIFKDLSSWFIANPKEAKELFNELYANKHKIYDDRAIAAAINEVSKLQEQNEKLVGVRDHLKKKNETLSKELKQWKERTEILERRNKRLEKMSSKNMIAETLSLELLLSLGITSQDELNRAFSSPEFEKAYTGKGRQFDFKYVLEINARTHKNVRAHLEKDKNYDCSGWNISGQSVVTGVKKHGEPIQLVLRPGDNDRILFPRFKEKNALHNLGAELWVDDGMSTPRQITIGELLKIAEVVYFKNIK